MKKVSTVKTEQSRKISQQRLTIGLDLGDRNSGYCVMDEAGQIQLEQPVRTTEKALREIFGVMPRSRVALEIGTHSPWVSRMLNLFCVGRTRNRISTPIPFDCRGSNVAPSAR
jgi:transposase